MLVGGMGQSHSFGGFTLSEEGKWGFLVSLPQGFCLVFRVSTESPF
jgi:hypothetical protein